MLSSLAIGMASVLKISKMSAEGRGVILEIMDLMAGLASRIMTHKRVTWVAAFSSMRPTRFGGGIQMTWQREGVKAEFRICVSVFEVWEVTARTVTLKLW